MFFFKKHRYRALRYIFFHLVPRQKKDAAPIAFAEFRSVPIFISKKMKTIQIKAAQFFELLKLKDTSMWEIFAQMISEKEQELIFMNERDEILFNYILPTNLEKLKEDQKIFAQEYAEKLQQN